MAFLLSLFGVREKQNKLTDWKSMVDVCMDNENDNINRITTSINYFYYTRSYE